MITRISPTVVGQLAASLVITGLWAAPALGQVRQFSPTAASEDYLFVCRNDGPMHRCVELMTSKDLRTGQATARFNYSELDVAGPGSRGLSCWVAVPALELTSNGKRLNQAAIDVTVTPESEECLGSWGLWPAGPMTFKIGMTASGSFSQQFKGHGVVSVAGSEYRFTETLESWAVNATGSVDLYDFSGASGSVQTLRRTDVSKTK
jgi:hypothetical protein